MEFLKLYISNFWIWFGITIGMLVLASVIISLIKELFKFLGIVVRGYPKEIQKTEEKKDDIAEKLLKKNDSEDWKKIRNSINVSEAKVEVR